MTDWTPAKTYEPGDRITWRVPVPWWRRALHSLGIGRPLKVAITYRADDVVFTERAGHRDPRWDEYFFDPGKADDRR